MSQTLRSILVVFAGGAALVLVLDRFVKSPDFHFPKDFLEYWGSGWLNLHGENPYDGEKLLAVQRSEQPDRESAVMMWNPPPSLAVYMPLGLMGARWASILWLCLQFAAIMLACHWLWKLYAPDTPSRVRTEAVPATAKGSWLPALAGFACVGTWWVIGYGQNTGLLALGLAGYLY
ncbi:MAG TPA: glycosyltransferase 87 family protein, partial [Gemmata sp.]|nr:glycosyltransferase 87 family protein [Gemmata sp.]